MARNLWFFDHDNPEAGGKEAEARSYMNLFEAEMVLVLVKHLVRQGYKPEQIAVLTPYHNNNNNKKKIKKRKDDEN